MIPGDPQIRAQINTTHIHVNSVVDSGTLLETASKGNRIVTLKSYSYLVLKFKLEMSYRHGIKQNFKEYWYYLKG